MQVILGEDELRKLSDIFVVIGEVFFASLAIPVFTGEYELKLVFIGLATTCVAWIASVYLVKKAKLLT